MRWAALRWPGIDLGARELVIQGPDREPDPHHLREGHQNGWGTAAGGRLRLQLAARRLPALAALPLDKRLRRLRDRVGIDKAVHLHDLRPFTATRLLDAGVPVKRLCGRVGYARPETTLNIHARFVPGSDGRAADAMGRILSLGEVAAAPPASTALG